MDIKEKRKRCAWYALPFLLSCLFFACRAPQAIQYQQVSSVRIMHVDIGQPELGMDLKFYNPNAFAVDVKDMDIDVFLNDNYLGKARLSKPMLAPAMDTFLLPVALSAQLKQIIPNALQVLSKQEIDLRLSGFLRVGKGVYMKVPVNYKGKQKLNIF